LGEWGWNLRLPDTSFRFESGLVQIKVSGTALIRNLSSGQKPPVSRKYQHF
jgi:hypothetical protein